VTSQGVVRPSCRLPGWPGPAGRTTVCLPAIYLPGGSSDEGGDDVGRVAVQRDPGPVVPHRGPRVSVGGSFLHVPQRHPGVQTGRERFTNRVEYLKPRSGEMRALIFLGASLPLPQMHQRVTRRYEADAASWRLPQSGPQPTMLTWGYFPRAACGRGRAWFWIPLRRRPLAFRGMMRPGATPRPWSAILVTASDACRYTPRAAVKRSGNRHGRRHCGCRLDRRRWARSTVGAATTGPVGQAQQVRRRDGRLSGDNRPDRAGPQSRRPACFMSRQPRWSWRLRLLSAPLSWPRTLPAALGDVTVGLITPKPCSWTPRFT